MSAVATNPKPATAAKAGGFPVYGWVATGLLGLAFLWLFYRFFDKQHDFSRDKLEDWGHAYVVPLIAGYMVWRVRDAIRSTPRSVFWPGLAPMLLGVWCYFFFIVGVQNHMLQGASMVLTLGGLLLLTLGPAMLRHLFLPLAMLLLGVTISEQIMIKVTFPLQIIAAQGADILLKIGSLFGGFLVEREGNTLKIITAKETVPLNVAEACSGMRMVVAFIALAATVGILQCRHWWQRIALVLSAVPVAVLLNVVRVAALGFATLIDPALASGDMHMLIGLLLLLPGLGLFLFIQWMLDRIVLEGPAGAKASKA